MAKSAKRPTNLYLRFPSGDHARLAWFQNNKPNEMLMNVYGLGGGVPIIRHEFPLVEQRLTKTGHVDYRYADAKQMNTTLDHITCHADGRFHLKTIDNKNLYIHEMRRTEPLGPNTSVFLEFILMTDMVDRYPVVPGPPKQPYVDVNVQPGTFVSIRAAFSGASHALEGHIAGVIDSMSGGRPAVVPGISLKSGTLRGSLLVYKATASPEMRRERPPGTVLSFAFPVEDGMWHIKTFNLD